MCVTTKQVGWFHSLRTPARRSLQHDVFEVLLQDGVFDGVEDEADVFCVHRRGEVVEQRLPPVPPLTAERLHQERLEGEGSQLQPLDFFNVARTEDLGSLI